MARVTLYVCVALLLTVFLGCGGGTASVSPMPKSEKSAIELAIKLAVAGNSNTSQPIKAIQVTLELPNDVTVLPDSTGNMVTCLNPNAIIQTNYNVILNTITFSLLPSIGVETGQLEIGKIARITYETKSGSALSVADVQPVYSVAGPKGTDGIVVPLTSEVMPVVSLVTY